jgi:hypothetical protein
MRAASGIDTASRLMGGTTSWAPCSGGPQRASNHAAVASWITPLASVAMGCAHVSTGGHALPSFAVVILGIWSLSCLRRALAPNRQSPRNGVHRCRRSGRRSRCFGRSPPRPDLALGGDALRSVNRVLSVASAPADRLLCPDCFEVFRAISRSASPGRRTASLDALFRGRGGVHFGCCAHRRGSRGVFFVLGP